MRIGVELRLVTYGVTGGMAQLLKGVLDALFRLYPHDEYTVFGTVFNRELFEDAPANVHVLSLPVHDFFVAMDQEVARRGIKVLFRSYPTDHLMMLPLQNQVFHIPDVQHETYPAFFERDTLRARRIAFQMVLSQAGAIGTISEYARRTLLNSPWAYVGDVFLMAPALPVDHRQTSVGELTEHERSLIPQERYLMYPANLWPHKNHRRVLQAFERVTRYLEYPVSLVFTGHPTGWEPLQREFGYLPIRHLGYVRPPLLRALYERATALTFFSLYEGFGMPLLEAFDAGVPVLCSNVTSLPEVAGDAALMCDPSDVVAMSELMLRILRDDTVRDELAARGRQRLALFSWEDSAHQLAAALTRVAADSGWRAIEHKQSLAQHEQPLVSIVTPSYNQGRFLRRTIESVLNQSYQNIEYLVIDGGSTDDTVSILQSYGDRFVWVSEPDRGQTHAINKGFARARGEILAYLNSDDVLELDAIEKVVAHFRQHPECDMLYGRAYYIDEHDRVTGMYNTAEYSFERMLHDCCVCQPATFWRRRIADRVGPFNEQLHYVMDFEYWLRIDRAGGNIQHTHKILASSRLYPDTKTLSARGKIFQEIFRISLEQAGYVDYNYVYSYWHHRMFERTTGWPTLLRRIRGSLRVTANLHYHWYNRRRYTPERLARGFLRRVRAHSWSSHLLQVLIVLSRLSGYHTSGRKSVVGFFQDNWMGPYCRIILSTDTNDIQRFIAGKAIVDCRMSVRLGGRELFHQLLTAGKVVRLSFDIHARANEILSLHFSHSRRASDGRKIAFQVESTNLFSEEDVW